MPGQTYREYDHLSVKGFMPCGMVAVVASARHSIRLAKRFAQPGQITMTTQNQPLHVTPSHLPRQDYEAAQRVWDEWRVSPEADRGRAFVTYFQDRLNTPQAERKENEQV